MIHVCHLYTPYTSIQKRRNWDSEIQAPQLFSVSRDPETPNFSPFYSEMKSSGQSQLFRGHSSHSNAALTYISSGKLLIYIA